MKGIRRIFDSFIRQAEGRAPRNRMKRRLWSPGVRREPVVQRQQDKDYSYGDSQGSQEKGRRLRALARLA